MNFTQRQKEFLRKFFQLMNEYKADIVSRDHGHIDVFIDNVDVGTYEEIMSWIDNMVSGGN